MKEQLRKIVREIMREAVLSEMKSVNESANPKFFPNGKSDWAKSASLYIGDKVDILLLSSKLRDVNDAYYIFKKDGMFIGSSDTIKGGTPSGNKINIKLSDVRTAKSMGDLKMIVDESVVNESASKEAMGIAGFTGTRGDAVQSFIDKHELDAMKLFNYVKVGKLKERMDFVTALVGNPGNKFQKMIISKFGINESVNEDVINETKFIAFWNNKQHEIDGKDLWDAKQKAITMLKVPKSKVGLLAVVSAESQKRQDFRFN